VARATLRSVARWAARRESVTTRRAATATHRSRRTAPPGWPRPGCPGARSTALSLLSRARAALTAVYTDQRLACVAQHRKGAHLHPQAVHARVADLQPLRQPQRRVQLLLRYSRGHRELSARALRAASRLARSVACSRDRRLTRTDAFSSSANSSHARPSRRSCSRRKPRSQRLSTGSSARATSPSNVPQPPRSEPAAAMAAGRRARACGCTGKKHEKQAPRGPSRRGAATQAPLLTSSRAAASLRPPPPTRRGSSCIAGDMRRRDAR